MVLLITLYLTNVGIKKYDKILENKTRFQQLETANIKKLVSYTIYGSYGFRLLFLPSKSSIFLFNSGVIPQVTAFIDSGVRLWIYNSFLGDNVFDYNTGICDDVGGIFLLLGGVIFAFFGFKAARNNEFAGILSTVVGFKKAYFYYFSTRLAVLNLFTLLIVCSSLLFAVLSHVSLTGTDLANLIFYVIVILITNTVFFLLGAIAGSINSIVWGLSFILLTLSFLFFAAPSIVKNLISNNSKAISSMEKFEIEKLEILMKFEEQALDEAQRYRNMEERVTSERKLIESYWVNEFKRIQGIEKKMRYELMRHYDKYRKISILIPTTFYRLVTAETSSQGYSNLFNFYDFVFNCQEKFIRYYQIKKFYSNYSKIEPFIKGNQNIFYAKSSLPSNFTAGLLLNLFYIILLSGLSYYRFKKSLYRPAMYEKPVPKEDRIILFSRRYNAVEMDGHQLRNLLFNLFSGITPITQKNSHVPEVYVDDENLVESPGQKKLDFIYIGDENCLPQDVKAGDLFNFFAGITGCTPQKKSEISTTLNIDNFEKITVSDLKKSEKALLLMSIARMKKTGVYLFYNTAIKMSMKFNLRFKDYIHDLAKDGAAVIYLTNDIQPSAREELGHNQFLDHTNLWSGLIEASRNINTN